MKDLGKKVKKAFVGTKESRVEKTYTNSVEGAIEALDVAREAIQKVIEEREKQRYSSPRLRNAERELRQISKVVALHDRD